MSLEERPHGKIGDGHASAMFRQGLRELRGALYPESNVAQNPEYGLYGTKTPGEIAEDRRPEERDMDEEFGKDRGSILGERLRQAEVGKDRGVVGLYYVDARLCSVWSRLLGDAGVPPARLRVEADIVSHPVLPSFE